MTQKEFEEFAATIHGRFSFLQENDFQPEKNYSGPQDNWVGFRSKVCLVTFVLDRFELFIVFQSISGNPGEETFRFELEVIVAYITDFSMIIRGPNRILEPLDKQISSLYEKFLMHKESILALFSSENFPRILPELICAKKKINQYYSDYIRQKGRKQNGGL